VRFFGAAFKTRKEPQALTLSRPVVLLQSDDWGRVGVRDREGCELLRSRGIRLGEHPYDLYTLETADDVKALASLLGCHRDSGGHHPSLVMNFCTANLDFERIRSEGSKALAFLPLAQGWPGKWSRPGLLDAYRAGIQSGVFHPALHGISHFCRLAMENVISRGGERKKLLQLLWEAETPYIYWRMPWIGYEYWNPEKPRAGFLSAGEQSALIEQAVKNFVAVFGVTPTSACAPGYRANSDTHRAWAEAGIRIAQNGTGNGLHAPHLDEFGILHTYRTIDFEPSQREVDVDKYLEIANTCFAKGLPLVISVHSINFHSTLKDFRTPALASLDALLTALEHKFPKLLYVNDGELREIVTTGAIRGEKATVTRAEWKQCAEVEGTL